MEEAGLVYAFLFSVVKNCFASNSYYYYYYKASCFGMYAHVFLNYTIPQHDLTTSPAQRLSWPIQRKTPILVVHGFLKGVAPWRKDKTQELQKQAQCYLINKTHHLVVVM